MLIHCVSDGVHFSRLSLEDFRAILAQAETLSPWIGNAMLLGLLIGQRRADIVSMQFRHIKDGWLHVEQHKTGAKVRLSLDIGLENMTIGDAVSRCRDRVVSRYLIHQVRNTPRAKAGSPVNPVSISREFARARDMTGRAWKGAPPSFHEIRSLSARLYGKQGLDAQALLGHSDPATTRKYLDSKGMEWIEVHG